METFINFNGDDMASTEVRIEQAASQGMSLNLCEKTVTTSIANDNGYQEAMAA